MKYSDFGLKTKICFNILPLGLVTILTLFLTAQDLRQNGSNLRSALEFQSLVQQLYPSALIQANASKGMLLNIENLGEYSEQKISAYDRNISILSKLPDHTQDQRMLNFLDELATLDKEQIRPLDTKILELLFEDQKKAIDIYYKDFLPLQEQYLEIINKIVKLGEELVAVAESDFEKNNNNTLFNLLALMIGGGAAIAAGLYLTAKIISEHLGKSVDIIASESENFHDVSEKVQSGSKEISDFSKDSLSDAKDSIVLAQSIETRANSLSTHSDNIKNSADELGVQIKLGKDRVEELTKRNQNLTDSFQNIEELHSIIQSICKKVASIDKIVFKTNLLSLNASIEAARAGKYGRGFSVVASEVGNLANLSGGLSQEINRLLQSSTEHTQKVIGEAKESLEAERKAITAMTDIFSSFFGHVQSLIDTIHEIKSEIDNQSESQKNLNSRLTQIVSRLERSTKTIEGFTLVVSQLKDSEDGIQNVESIIQREIKGDHVEISKQAHDDVEEAA